jgi:hypothetical protein
MAKLFKSVVIASGRHVSRLGMLSLLRAHHLHLHVRARGFPLNHTRNFAYTSNGVKRKRGRPPKSASVVGSTEHRNCPIIASLDRYSRLPPLPPVGDWLSHFPSAQPVVRDRISIRDPASAIRIAHSFITSENSTGNPKIIIEAFPGA